HLPTGPQASQTAVFSAQDSCGNRRVAGPQREAYNYCRDEPGKKCASPHDDSRPNSVTKTQHQVSNAERALLVGVGWKRTPRFPGMPAGEQGRESLAELVELARSAGARSEERRVGKECRGGWGG